jgi:xanthine dehydrogenase accessory factor
MRAELFQRLLDGLQFEQAVLVVTVVEGPGVGNQLILGPRDREALGTLGSEALDREALRYAEGLLGSFSSLRRKIEIGSETYDVFFDVQPPPAKLIVIGAVHVAIHLVHFAKRLGFETVVIDPRTAFATPERFAEADRLVAQWPQEVLSAIPLNEASCFAVLSHDLKIDLPALELALRSPAGYIGALGSKKTHRRRVEALRKAGFSDAEIARIRSPIGLDLGGRRAEEIALAILAEIVATRHGRPTDS